METSADVSWILSYFIHKKDDSAHHAHWIIAEMYSLNIFLIISIFIAAIFYKSICWGGAGSHTGMNDQGGKRSSNPHLTDVCSPSSTLSARWCLFTDSHERILHAKNLPQITSKSVSASVVSRVVAPCARHVRGKKTEFSGSKSQLWCKWAFPDCFLLGCCRLYGYFIYIF